MNTKTTAEVGAYYAQHGRAIVLYDPQSTATRPILRLEPGEHEDVLLSLMDAANALPAAQAQLAEAVELLRTLSIDPESDGITRIRAFLDKVKA